MSDKIKDQYMNFDFDTAWGMLVSGNLQGINRIAWTDIQFIFIQPNDSKKALTAQMVDGTTKSYVLTDADLFTADWGYVQ